MTPYWVIGVTRRRQSNPSNISIDYRIEFVKRAIRTIPRLRNQDGIENGILFSIRLHPFLPPGIVSSTQTTNKYFNIRSNIFPAWRPNWTCVQLYWILSPHRVFFFFFCFFDFSSLPPSMSCFFLSRVNGWCAHVYIRFYRTRESNRFSMYTLSPSHTDTTILPSFYVALSISTFLRFPHTVANSFQPSSCL